MLIYHIVLPEVWDAFDTELYRVRGLETEGFIHCSFEHQLESVMERYYKAEPSVIVLAIDTEELMSRVLYEPSTNDEIYPHIYGPINRKAIAAVTEWTLNTSR